MTSGNVEDEAWITLATNDTYSLGALTLGKSLQRVGTNRKLVVLITPGVTSLMRERLGEVFHVVQEVNVLDSNDTANLRLLARPDLGITFTKLHCWKLTQYKKAVFLDADVLVLQNCDELFLREELSAAPDVGWPDCFNSGVFVFTPSNETYDALITAALTTGSFDGGDQGLLNVFFNTWATADIAKHLPFIYNMTSSCAYTYLPAYQQFSKDVKIVHFIGPFKPWMHKVNPATGHVESVPGAFHAAEHLQFWWNIFAAEVQPRLQPELAGLAGQLSLLSLGQELLQEQTLVDDRARQFAWEQGQADYMGADAFSNIQKKIDEALTSSPSEQTPLATEVTSLETSAATTGAGEQAASPSEVISTLPSSEVTSSVASVDSLAESLVTTALSPLLIGSAPESQKEQPGSEAIIPLPVTPDAHYTTEVSLASVTGGEQSPAVAPVIEPVAAQIQAVEPTEVQAALAAPIAEPAAVALPELIGAPAPAESAAAVLSELFGAPALAEPAAVVLPELVSAPAPAESAVEVHPELVSAPAPIEPVAAVLPELVSAPKPAAEVLPKPVSVPPPTEPSPTPVLEPVNAPAEPSPTPVLEPISAPTGPSPAPVPEPASAPAESTPKVVPESASAPAPSQTVQSAPEGQIPIEAAVQPTPLPPLAQVPTSPVTAEPSPASPTGKAPKASSKSKTPPASQLEAVSQPVAPPKSSKSKVSSPPSSQPATPTAASPAASSPLPSPSTPQQTQPPAAKKPKGSKKPKSP